MDFNPEITWPNLGTKPNHIHLGELNMKLLRSVETLPRQSQYWNVPCCRRCSHFSSGRAALWSQHFCFLLRGEKNYFRNTTNGMHTVESQRKSRQNSRKMNMLTFVLYKTTNSKVHVNLRPVSQVTCLAKSLSKFRWKVVFLTQKVKSRWGVHPFAGSTVIIKVEVIFVTAGETLPVQVITTSICRITSLSLTTRKPSMLHEHTQKHILHLKCSSIVQNEWW